MNPLTQTQPGRWTTEIIESGAKDAKGRTVGMYGTIEFRPEVTQAESDAMFAARGWGMNPRPACYVVALQAARDGAGFGASASGSLVETFEGAVAKLEKSIAGSLKRIARNLDTTGTYMTGKHKALLAERE